MTICKYFLQGTCRFGDSCKFEHQINNDHNYTSSTSVLLHNYANKPAQSGSNVDTNTLIKSVVNDMTSAEKGGQWLLSSYAPFKEKPAFPGFEDHSMEEIRYLFYESMRNGTLEQFKQNLQMMLQQAVMKIKALQNPTPDAVNMLKSIYNTPPSSSLNTNQSPFGTAATNSVFGGSPQQQQPTFGGTNANQNIFGGTNPSPNIFSAAPQVQASIFGGVTTNQSVFGGAQQNSLFNNQQASPTKSVFGNPTQTASSPVFGGNPVFGLSGTQSVFGTQPQQPSPFAQASPFSQQQPQQQQQQQQQQTLFTGQQTAFAPQQNIFQQNQFANTQTQNQFGVSQPSQSTTATLTGNKPSFQHTANIFGNLAQQQTNSSMFGGVPALQKPNEDFYSKLEDLTEEEIKWFQSDDLDVSKIPEKPPTYEMCFKT